MNKSKQAARETIVVTMLFGVWTARDASTTDPLSQTDVRLKITPGTDGPRAPACRAEFIAIGTRGLCELVEPLSICYAD